MISFTKRRLYGIEAEDIVQSVFCTAVRKADDLVASPNPEGWVYQALKYEILNEVKKSIRERKINERLTSVENPLCYADTYDRLMVWDIHQIAKRAKIRDQDFDFLILHYLYGFDYAFIAAAYKMSKEGCRTRVHRAKCKF